MLEVNASPDRRDLSELHARAAADAGVRLLINTDSHRVGGFRVARYGIATARRAWLGPAQIANTRPWSELQAIRKPTRTGHG
jgi:DNA polymerase (family 10)